MKKLSAEAMDLLKYVYKFKDGAFKEPFTASLFIQRNALGHSSVESINPILEELAKAKVLKNVKTMFKVPRYKINDKVMEKYMEEVRDEEFTQEYRDAVEEEIKKYNRFVITTAVMGKEVNKEFLASLENYAKRKSAMLLVLPCEDVASRKQEAKALTLSTDLANFKVIFKDTYLNRNLCLCAIKVSAKQINPLSGLDRLAVSRQASIIVASPKVFLKYVPNMHYDIPPALMTTGAITVNDYDNDLYMSKRTSTLAENDHAYGAVIVEIENENIFHFRHVQASETGSLSDLGVEYLPDGNIRKLEDTVMVVGDSHVGYHDRELHEEVVKLLEKSNTTKIVLHDIFNGTSISHHDTGKNITRATKAQEGKLNLEEECLAVKRYVQDFADGYGTEVFIPEANHNLHLLKFLEQGRYVSDPVNHKFSLKLAAVAVDGINPLQYAVESLLGYKKSSIHWLETDESCKFYGVECGIHGDIGAHGSRGSLSQFQKGIGNCVTAHTHSAAILRNAYCVGTVGEMDMKYNKGLSAWTRTCCLIYNNGTKQLVNFIPDKNGNYSYSLV